MKEKKKLVTAGRPKRRPFHPVNPAVERASTYLFPTYDDYIEGGRNIVYGRLGGPTHRALEDAINVLEGGYHPHNVANGAGAVFDALRNRPLRNEAGDPSPFKEDRKSTIGEGPGVLRRALHTPKYQPACKPGSVGHHSCEWYATAIPLGQGLHLASSNLPGQRA